MKMRSFLLNDKFVPLDTHNSGLIVIQQGVFMVHTKPIYQDNISKTEEMTLIIGDFLDARDLIYKYGM
jgi:sulfur transfer complex TusBCD TusB component (DsrH family)